MSAFQNDLSAAVFCQVMLAPSSRRNPPSLWTQKYWLRQGSCREMQSRGDLWNGPTIPASSVLIHLSATCVFTQPTFININLLQRKKKRLSSFLVQIAYGTYDLPTSTSASWTSTLSWHAQCLFYWCDNPITIQSHVSITAWLKYTYTYTYTRCRQGDTCIAHVTVTGP